MKLPILISLALVSFSAATGASPTELEGERAAANSACPSPEEARAKMTVPEGYEVRCFAHEPMIANPVAMTWDARGRLWVVEAFEYPEGTPLPVEKRPFGGEAKDDQYHPVPAICLPPSAIPKDRVVILEDTDNDGVADKRTVFVEGLNLASAIICGDDGIYVGQQPHIIHFLDADHDDKPEQWRVILTGFGREDTHELVNSFTWGPDGWLYMTHGVFTHSAVRRPGQPEKEGFKFDAGIGRARPVVTQAFQPARSENPQAGAEAQPRQTAGGSPKGERSESKPVPPWEFEVFADGTSNPWGCDYDAAGNFFVSACVIDHFFHMAPGGIYVRQGGAPENPYSYELLPSIVKHRHFRAAYAGVQIYQGGVYPRDTWGHAFIGNIHDNAIHEEIITPSGSTFTCEPRRDFLRANNGWFRPVSTQTGPDGNLWIMDWCDKYPCYQNAKANPAGVDRERGRIWRVVHVGVQASVGQASDPKTQPKGRTPTDFGSRPTKDMNLAKLATPELVKLLGDSNNWMRRMARRELVEHFGNSDRKWIASELKPALISVINDRANQELDARLESLWTLLALFDYQPELEDNAIDDRELKMVSTDTHSAIRLWAARIIGERDIPVIDLLSRLAGDPDPSVRLASCVALCQFFADHLTIHSGSVMEVTNRDEHMFEAFMSANRNEEAGLIPFMIWSKLEFALASEPKTTAAFLSRLAAKCQPLSRAITYKAMRRLCDTRQPENLDLALDFLTKIKSHDVLLAHALDGLVKGQEGGVIKPTKDFSALFAEFAKSDNADVRKHTRNLATLWGDEAAIRQLTTSLLDEKTPEPQRIAAVQTLRKVKGDAARAALLKVMEPSRLHSEDVQAGSLRHLSPPLALEVIRALADFEGGDIGEALLKVAQPFRSREGSGVQAGSLDQLQLAALGALSNRADWTHAMLDAIEAKKISATGFPVSLRRALATSKDDAIRDHASKVLGAWRESGEDIKALIAAKKKVCLEGEPDLANGRTLFTATCAVCHTFHGGGQKVGPDLIGSGRSNLDALLANVIDPNQIIGNGYENFTITTTDNRTLAGRVTEDTPSHVKLLAIGGAETVVPRDQIAKLENTHQSLMPMGFGNLPDAAFRDIIWYLLAPPDEGPLTPEKKKLLSTSIDLAPPAKAKGTGWRAIDWESVSHWNADWKVDAPEFEGTPQKLAEYHGKTNVLLMHPFPDKKTPASLERKVKIAPGKSKLHFSVAADDRGDWLVKALVNGEVVGALAVDHENPRWKDVEIDLAKWTDQEVTLRLEAHATGWSWEFGYWHGIELR